jgi:8-oxo-dGTP pyrophosphatase MutT (NUDIX family)
MAMSRVFSYLVRSGSSAEPMIVERETVRAILLTNANEVLLFRTHVPDKSEYFWVTPGGGLEPGESPEQGLRRQLREELSLDEFVMGALVWRRQLNWAGKRVCQRERCYVVRVDRFEPHPSDDEGEALGQFRWRPAPELAPASERLTPLCLAQMVADYLTAGPPALRQGKEARALTGHAHPTPASRTDWALLSKIASRSNITT